MPKVPFPYCLVNGPTVPTTTGDMIRDVLAKPFDPYISIRTFELGAELELPETNGLIFGRGSGAGSITPKVITCSGLRFREKVTDRRCASIEARRSNFE